MVYIRRYAGPLRIGERSAYVPGTRYHSKKALAAQKIQRRWRSYKARNPSRLTGSKTNYKVARAVSKAMSLYGENKFNGENLDCIRAVAKPTGTQPLTYVFFNTGTRVDSLLPEFTSARAMDLYNFPKGDGPTERTGDYLYLRKTHLKLEVQMLPGSAETANSLNQAIEFRLMIVKANRKVQGYGQQPDPGASLFLNQENVAFGYDNTVQTPYMYMNQPINKRQWLVYCDKKFTLSPPAFEHHSDDNNQSINSANPRYPIKKKMSINLPIWKKTYFSSNSGSDHPQNVDTQWFCVLQAVRTGYCASNIVAPSVNDFAMNVIATTTARDS